MEFQKIPNGHLFFFNVYFWEKETEYEQRGAKREETQNLKQASGSELSAQNPTQGSNSQTARLRPEPKSDTQPTEPPRHPMFIHLWERERDRVWVGKGQRERRHRIWSRLQAPSCQHRAWHRFWTHKPWYHELSQSRTLNRLSYPGAPELLIF